MRLRAEPVCSAHKMARLPHTNPMITRVSITQTQRDKCANTWGRTCALQSIHRTDQWHAEQHISFVIWGGGGLLLDASGANTPMGLYPIKINFPTSINVRSG